MVTMRKISKSRNCKIRVTFVMHPINSCNCLYLVGNFNEWNESVYRMQPTSDGTWSLILELEPGHEYQYRYRTDKGVWHTDPIAERYVPNADGPNSAVVCV